MDDPPFATRVINEFVKPIYLSVRMGQRLDPDQAALVSQLARQASVEEIEWMLRTHWRPRRVGAWFTFVSPDPSIDDVLLESLRSSMGYLSAPDLGFAAVRRLGRDALPALHDYQSTADQNNYGGLSEISALIESVGGSSEIAESTEVDHESLRNRASWADFIRGG